MRTIIHFSSRFTILPFLYLQALYHLCTIIYYGTSLHRSHVISHTLNLNHITPNVRYTHAYKGFVPLLIYQNKRKMTNIFQTEHHKYQITHELFTRTCFRLHVKQVCANVSFSKKVYHKEASHFYLIYKYPTSSK